MSDGWQKIETAPKDGTEFIAYLSNGWMVLARAPRPYNPEHSFQWWIADRLSLPIVETHPKDYDWKGSHCLLITHWMPLPPPPQQEEGKNLP